MTTPKTVTQASIDGVPELVTLGTRIRHQRSERQLSQEALADMVAVDFSVPASGAMTAWPQMGTVMERMRKIR